MLGVDARTVKDLSVIVGRDDLTRASGGREIPVRRIWVNPRYDQRNNEGDIAVLSLAEAVPERDSVEIAPPGDSAYRPGTRAVVYGWGDTRGDGSYARALSELFDLHPHDVSVVSTPPLRGPVDDEEETR